MNPGKEEAVLRAVGMAAERFLAASDWHSVADEILGELGTATHASRVHIYSVTQAEDGEVRCSLLHEWTGGEVTAQIDNPEEQDFPLKAGGYERWIDVLSSGALIQGLRAEFPESERDFLKGEDILSVLVVPVFAGGRWWGWIGFDDTGTERRWNQGETDALRAAAGVLGAAIQRVHMEEGRLSAEAKYRALVEQLPNITYMSTAGPEDTILYISPQVHDLLGYTAAEWLKTPKLWEKALHPDDRERVLEASQASGSSEDRFQTDYRIFTRYGKQLWVHDEAVLVYREDGTPMYWQGIMLDITAQKEAEEQAAESQARFRGIVEHIPVTTYAEPVRSPEGGMTDLQYISPQVFELSGYSVDEWMTIPGLWRSIIHPDDREWVLSIDDDVEESQKHFAMEYRIVRKDGGDVWVHDEAVIVRGEHGEALFWQGILLDVTREHEAERAAQEAEERFQTLVAQVPAAICIDALEGRSTGIYVSPQIQMMTGYSAGEWLADPELWERIIHPDDRERVLAIDDHSDATGAPFDAEYRMVHRDGHIVWVHEVMNLQLDPDGKPMQWQGAILDVSDSRRSGELEWALEVERSAAQRLRDLDFVKNTYLTTIAHDLRTPLSVILGLALTMQRDELSLGHDEIRDFSSRIAQHARKLDRMVKDLLDLEKLTAGTMGVTRQPTELAPLISRIVREADYLEEHPVTVGVPAMTANVDPAKVERIIENLLVNAANHTPSGTPVWIGASREEGSLLLRVDDAGPGVPVERREEVFAPFVPGEESTGSGVGLSLVARLAELHGGRAWVDEREGGGASFRVLINVEG